MKNLLAFILLIPILCFGQEEYQDIRKLFPKPNEQVEVKTYKGYLNHIHPVIFLLGMKDRIVKGTYRLSSSGNVIRLNGTYNDGSYNLFELSSEDEIGRIIIDTKSPENSFWTDLENSDILPIHVTETRFGQLAFDNKNGIVTQYVSTSKNHNIQLLVEKTDPDRAFLKIWIDERYIESWSRCEGNLCVTSQFEKPISLIQDDENPHIKIGESGISLKETKSGTIKKFAYATKDMLIDIDYVTDVESNYDQWIRNIILNERQKNIDKIQSLIDSESSLPHFRYHWSGWQEIDEFNEEYISGRLVWYESWSETTKTIPIFYSFEEMASINVNSTFQSPEDKKEMMEWIYKEENPLIHCVGLEASEDIMDYTFTNYTVSNHQLFLLTDFSPVYGYKKVLIPYHDAKKWLDRKSLIRKLIKK